MDDFEDFEDFLAHHGVKGQKWGVRRSTSSGSSSSSSRKSASSPSHAAEVAKHKQEAITAAKVALTVTRYGVVPLAAATGIGIPAMAGLGLSMKLVNDPGVRVAVKAAGNYTKSVVSNFNGVPLSKLPMPHVKNPFSVSTSKMHEAGAGNPSFRVSKGGQHEMLVKGTWVKVTPGLANSILNHTPSSHKG